MPPDLLRKRAKQRTSKNGSLPILGKLELGFRQVIENKVSGRGLGVSRGSVYVGAFCFRIILIGVGGESPRVLCSCQGVSTGAVV